MTYLRIGRRYTLTGWTATLSMIAILAVPVLVLISFAR